MQIRPKWQELHSGFDSKRVAGTHQVALAVAHLDAQFTWLLCGEALNQVGEFSGFSGDLAGQTFDGNGGLKLEAALCLVTGISPLVLTLEAK